MGGSTEVMEHRKHDGSIEEKHFSAIRRHNLVNGRNALTGGDMSALKAHNGMQDSRDP